MFSDCDNRKSFKSFRSASLVSSLLDSGGSKKIHPLDPSITLEFESTDAPERGSIHDSSKLLHMGRASSSRSSIDSRRGLQHKRSFSKKVKTNLAEGVPSYFRKNQGGPTQRAPINSPSSSNMEFLRGVYAFMQVSRSSVNHVKTDSSIFRLHTNATVILLVTFSIAVTTRQYVGNPIDCVHTRDIPEDVLNTYCWIHSTYTVVDAFMKKQGQEVPFPGVDNSQRSGALTIRHTKYYQWVAFTLFFQ
uniref:Innexin n=1 Tax=Anopheles epiroticus TaxID=199890 RepID=A0A182PGZ8_9DIPT